MRVSRSRINQILSKLRKEGYIVSKQEEKQKIFYELLANTMMKMEGDKTIRPDIEKFLRENITRI